MSHKLICAHVPDPTAPLVWSCDGQAIILASISSVHVFDLHRTSYRKYHYLAMITALAACPLDATVAIGEESGRIRFSAPLYKVSSNSVLEGKLPKKGTYPFAEHSGSHSSVVTRNLLQWHAHAVADLSFSSDGKYLFSVGEEVLLLFSHLLPLILS